MSHTTTFNIFALFALSMTWRLTYCEWVCQQYSCNTTASAQYTAALKALQVNELQALYTSLNGTAWKRQEGWLTSADSCSWAGVGCCNATYTIKQSTSVIYDDTGQQLPSVVGCCCPIPGAIVSLTLSHNNLSGSLAGLNFAVLGQTLLHMRLQGNNLMGTIPSSLTQLTALQTIDLSSNQLTGSIPSALSSIPSLEVILLEENLLTGTIPKTLSSLTRLVDFMAGANRLSGHFPVWFFDLPNANVLKIDFNNLTGALDAEGMPSNAGPHRCE